ncbi:hypothetical protein [uncultured Roseibium sp.]|uniref:hypothetical protein n=1 Tax=uncultured Roseibium sp. TaxID=1936171 RepID=UPI00262F26AE|nr:hypothetical protein [uncultured Roseibium sp.]
MRVTLGQCSRVRCDDNHGTAVAGFLHHAQPKTAREALVSLDQAGDEVGKSDQT